MRRATPAKAPSVSGGHGQRLRVMPNPRSLKRDLCAFRAVVFPQRGKSLSCTVRIKGDGTPEQFAEIREAAKATSPNFLPGNLCHSSAKRTTDFPIPMPAKRSSSA